MILVDVNLLLYAVVSGFPAHEAARSWWEDLLNGETEVALSSPAIFGFLRIATHPRVLDAPLSIDAAIGHVLGWLDQPNVRFLAPGQRHLDIAFGLLRELGTAANLATDAQLAALAIEYDAELCSNDTDFGRFRTLHWVDPISGRDSRRARRRRTQ